MLTGGLPLYQMKLGPVVSTVVSNGPKAIAGHSWASHQKAEKEHFGNLHRAKVKCQIVKYVACRDGNCAVKKTVTCMSVCKYAGFSVARGLHYDHCKESLCEGYWRVNNEGVSEKVSAKAMLAMLAKRDKMQKGSDKRMALETNIAMLTKQSFGGLVCAHIAMLA